jgi:hypothetical protein
MEDPDKDATEPTAPGNDAPDGGVPDPELAGAVVVGDDDAVVVTPPQAARIVASDRPAAAAVTLPRCRMFR